MKLVCISDTHGRHHDLAVPDGDVLIHAGDCTSRGRMEEVVLFLRWMEGLPHRHKIMVAGNHDFMFEQIPGEAARLCEEHSVVYLNDSGHKCEGVRFWGSPITPWFYDWAFNRERGPEISKHWDAIPEGVDVLITHGPPRGVLDHVPGVGRQGCEDLAARVRQVQPRLHVFGHIHEGAGTMNEGSTMYINASVLDGRYRLKHAPVVIELEPQPA